MKMKYFKQNYNIDPKLVCFDKKNQHFILKKQKKSIFL